VIKQDLIFTTVICKHLVHLNDNNSHVRITRGVSRRW